MENRRLELFRQALAQQELDGFFMRNESDIQWITGFDGVFDGEGAFGLLVTADQAVLHTDSRYAVAVNRAAVGTPFTVSLEPKTHGAVALAALPTAGKFAVGLEETLMLGEYRKLLERADALTAENQGMTVVFVDTQGVGVNLRGVKDANEIARMRAAQAITDAAFSHIIQYMRPGMTERQVQVELEDFMLRHGASGLAFSSIVATGANGASPHAIPGETVLEAGQCVVLDFGARAHGYCSDMTRVVFLGDPSPEMRAAYEVLREANETVERMLKPGVTGAQAHNKAEEILAAGGFDGKMGHSLGHGVGLDIHEQPNLSPRNDAPLQEGNVVTVEPGIYLEGQFGMRLEDFGVITSVGFHVFTQSTHEMVII
ncbi:MAG: aminopeptidase P family protein [Eggerthellales bacterium]|nr:aminopeptidase P family protein [Eggerthellales bacterium]